MLKREIVVWCAAAALVFGLGVGSALASGAPRSSTPAVTAGSQGGQKGIDEQEAANDVAEAADDVQSEVESETADDQTGDETSADDQSEAQDDQGEDVDDQGEDQQDGNNPGDGENGDD